jgi:hypothetical protein
VGRGGGKGVDPAFAFIDDGDDAFIAAIRSAIDNLGAVSSDDDDVIASEEDDDAIVNDDDGNGLDDDDDGGVDDDGDAFIAAIRSAIDIFGVVILSLPASDAVTVMPDLMDSSTLSL